MSGGVEPKVQRWRPEKPAPGQAFGSKSDTSTSGGGGWWWKRKKRHGVSVPPPAAAVVAGPFAYLALDARHGQGSKRADKSDRESPNLEGQGDRAEPCGEPCCNYEGNGVSVRTCGL